MIIVPIKARTAFRDLAAHSVRIDRSSRMSLPNREQAAVSSIMDLW